jgi:GT2 family glycosyltransferase
MSKRNRNKRNLNKPTTGTRIVSRTDVDIVIPLYGKLDFFKECLSKIPEACKEHSYDIIVVNNATPKEAGIIEVFKEVGPQCKKIINLASNTGFPHACNLGASYGFSSYILFLNSDVFLDTNSIDIMIEDMKQDEKLAEVGPKLLFSTGTPNGPQGTIQHAGLEINIHSDVLHQFIGWNADNPKVNIRCEPQALTGACILVRRKAWQEAHGFFEGYGMGTYEDVELSLTFRQLGYTILYEPKASGHHYVGASSLEYKIQFPLGVNRELFIQRNMGRFGWSDWARY